MRFMFSTTRGTGHLQPLLPYARVLQARGHDVIVAAPEEVAEPLRQAGFDHAPFDHPGAERLGPIWARLSSASDQEGQVIAVREIFAGLNAQVALPKLTQAIESWRPDLIVRDSMEFAALVAAERVGLPHARIAVHAPSFEDDTVLGQVGEPLAALRAAAGLQPDDGASLRREPVFCAFPPSWDRAASEGAGTLPPLRARMPEDPSPADASPWRPAGDPSLPLVYFTFGTIAGGIARIRFVYRLALDAVAELPVRAVLTTGPGIEADALEPIPSNVEVKAWIPQRDVLAHAAAVVCHGGSGTVRGALATGLPLVVLPFGADQPYNAQRIAAVGAGLALDNPDVAALRAAVQRVLIDTDLRAGAKNMAAEIAALPSLEQAVDELITLARQPVEGA
jgi:UDP:flavonoid glycosyltransferase YjiC (YdhE family)